MAKTTVHVADNAKFGKILVDADGRTLYHFDKDKNGKVACTGSCATTWPPLLVAKGTKPSGTTGLGTVQRPDGTTQVTYHGEPLYRYSGDSKAGDTRGDGVAGLWHVVKAQ
jgi:predicted lipoprotein with Yx(FWY)xxD motif